MNMKAIYQTPVTLRTSIEPQVILAGSGPAVSLKVVFLQEVL